MKKKKNGNILSFLEPKATSVPSTVNSLAPVYSYKLATHSANDIIPASSTTAVQDKTVSLMFKPVAGPISNSFIKTL